MKFSWKNGAAALAMAAVMGAFAAAHAADEASPGAAGMPLPAEIGGNASPHEGPVIKAPVAADPMATTDPSAVDPLAWSSEKTPENVPPPAPEAAPVPAQPSPLAETPPPVMPPPAAEPLGAPPPTADAAPAVPAPVVPAESPVVPSTEAPPADPLAAAPPSAEQQPAPAAPSAIEDRLSALEKKVDALSNGNVSRSDFEALKSAVDALGKSPAAQKPAVEKAAAEASAPRAKKQKKPAASVSTKTWLLKSAKPGQAWVAEPGSSELHTISVGESLKGIGKVTAIEKDPMGRWVVSGARGKIVQGR